jgi:hypothetical protein
MNKPQFITMMTIIAAIIFQSNVFLADEPKQQYSHIRLQKNEWIQILEQKEEKEFDEEYGFECWYLHVKILFLKYCEASKKKSKLNELVHDSQASSNEIGEAFGQEIMNIEYILPMFRCDYRTSVFLTLYSSDGKEIDTMKAIPIASKNKLEIMPGETIWVTFVRAIIPPHLTQPKSWQVWVPK